MKCRFEYAKGAIIWMCWAAFQQYIETYFSATIIGNTIITFSNKQFLDYQTILIISKCVTMIYKLLLIDGLLYLGIEL